ncbi:MAG: amino acid ABC transporter permease [Nocardioides sp.]
MSTSAAPRHDDGGLRERLAMASAEVPFRTKVAAVWVVIFAVVGVFFYYAAFDVGWMSDKATFVAKGLRFTVQIAIGGIVLAVVLACLGALARISRNPVAYGVAGFYTSFFRGTPLIVQLFLFYLAIPQVAINLDDRFDLGRGFIDFFTWEPIVVGILVLGLNYGAYMTEIFRAGIQSVSGGQSEAAEALGMTYGQKMLRVILPQAFRVIIPPTGNEFIAMMKDTALIGVIGGTIENAEIFRRASLVGKADFKNLEAYLLAALIYWILTIIFTYFQERLEARVAKGYVRGGGGDDDRANKGGGKAAPPVEDLDKVDPTLRGGEH